MAIGPLARADPKEYPIRARHLRPRLPSAKPSVQRHGRSQCAASRQSRQIQEKAQDYSGFGLKSQTPTSKSARLASRAPARAAARRNSKRTTHATNAIVTGTVAKTAFLTTEGFPDILVLREGGKARGVSDDQGDRLTDEAHPVRWQQDVVRLEDFKARRQTKRCIGRSRPIGIVRDRLQAVGARVVSGQYGKHPRSLERRRGIDCADQRVRMRGANKRRVAQAPPWKNPRCTCPDR
jgi:hypothetical protein